MQILRRHLRLKGEEGPVFAVHVVGMRLVLKNAFQMKKTILSGPELWTAAWPVGETDMKASMQVPSIARERGI